MLVADLLTVGRIIPDALPASKKRALELLSTLIAQEQSGMDANLVFDSLLARERLGSTGLGHGVAIPHGRVRNATTSLGAFIRLQQPIDYDAMDGEPVDLLFGLLVPEESTEEHLQILARLAEMFSNPDFVKQLRHCSTADELYTLLSTWTPAG